jgi:hypothetical protein
MFSDGQALVATAASANQLDAGKVGTPRWHIAGYNYDLGVSYIPLALVVTESFNNLTSITVTVRTDDNAAMSSPTVVSTSPAIPLTRLTKGSLILIPCEIPEGTRERYIDLNYTLAGTAPTTGKITAGVVAGRQSGVL